MIWIQMANWIVSLGIPTWLVIRWVRDLRRHRAFVNGNRIKIHHLDERLRELRTIPMRRITGVR